MSKKIYRNEVAVITPAELEAAFEGETRQYIMGDLKQEQKLPFIYSDECEMGITVYDEYTHDDPHYHDYITETNYIIEGKVMLHIVETGEDYLVEKGGIFSVPPHVTHVLKAQAGTKIIFTKSKMGNDKHAVDFEGLGLEDWFQDQDF